MVLYQFKCKECGNEIEEAFPVAEYDKRITEDGRLKRKRCEKCSTIKFYRHITQAPSIMGGTSGYMSMDRYWKNNPDIAKKKEEQLEKKLEERHRKKVMDRIDKHKRRQGADKRGQGYKEDGLKLDDN